MMTKAAMAAEAEARFAAAAQVNRAAQIARLSPVERKARGIMRALGDVRMAGERAARAAERAMEQVDAFAAQAEELEAELAALPDPDEDGDE
jgi:hypothetical protein